MPATCPALGVLRAMSVAVLLLGAPFVCNAGPSQVPAKAISPPPSAEEAEPAGRAAGSDEEPAVKHYPGYELEDDSYKVLTAPSYGDCAVSCTEDPRCRALEYYIDKRDCGLFDRVPSKRRRSGVDAGIVIPPAKSPPQTAQKPALQTPTLQKLRRRYVEGEGYETIAGSSFEDCSSRCLRDERCRMLEFYRPKEKCNLFDHQRSNRSSDDDAEVAVKR